MKKRTLPKSKVSRPKDPHWVNPKRKSNPPQGRGRTRDLSLEK